MFQRIGAALMAITVILLSIPAAAQDMPVNPRVRVETSEGNFEIELFRDQVPATAVNFLVYARQGYYDGTVFHRIIRDTIIQGGGFNLDEDSQLVPKTEGLRGPILNEARQSLKNRRGTVAMARLAEPNSARQQFFINLDNNTSFDYRNGTAQGIGYAVFGEVTEGMDVVQRIGRVRTTNQGQFRGVPQEPVIIHSITHLED